MLLYLFILIFGLFTSNAHASAKDRCVVDHCTCSVRPGPIVKRPSRKIAKATLSIYFEEDEYKLTIDQSIKIKSFVSAYGDYLIVAYTDGCASYQHNQNLASKRLESVNRYMTHSAKTKIIPEESSSHSPKSRRVDVIRTQDLSLAATIARVSADVYLLDGSGSMAGAQGWKDIVSASFKSGTKIYVSKVTGCYNGQTLPNVPYGGGTEIWYSYWWVLKRMQPNQTLLVVSDFESRYSLLPSERAILESIIKEKNITVYAIKLK